VWRVPGSGGPRDTAVEADSGTPVAAPSVLPNGRAVLMTMWRRGTPRPPDPADAEIGVAPLHSKEVCTLVRGLYGRYALAGYLVFVRMDGALLAAPFDPDRLTLTGPEVPLLEGFVMRGPSAPFSMADNGTLVYWSGPPAVQQAVWVGADGRETPVDPALQRRFGGLALSPDGRRLVVSLTGEGANAPTDLWVYELRQRTLSRLTFEGKFNDRPTWTPDGGRVTFVSDRAGLRALYTVPWDGSGPAQSLLAGPRLVQEGAWSHDGRVLVYRQGAGVGGTLRDIYYVRPGVDTVPRPFLASEFDEFSPALSPDDRWLVYVSNESGRDQVYVRPFPGPGGRWQISTEGGTEPAWARNGRSIYYRTSTDLMQVDVQTVPSFAVGARRRLFSTAAYASDRVARRYDIAPDGRFIFLREVAGPRELVVVLNWFEELKRRTTGGEQ
jgi:eukaryotic-like serine/threonine-protein kinase